MMRLSGWGRFAPVDCDTRAPRDAAALADALARGPAIARGMGRAYGDSALNATNTISMRHFDRFIAFDDETGQLVAEAGVTLDAIIAAFLPRGWFPAVTPGTRFVSLGGAIAADVHGKNHHCDGSFGAFVDWIEVMQRGGTILRASRTENAELFAHTLGGMGLTGVILRAAIRLRPVQTGWIVQELIPVETLDQMLDTFEGATDAPYSVAWLDAMSGTGRGHVMLGHHAAVRDLPVRDRATPFAVRRPLRLSLPVTLPGFVLSAPVMRLMNALYWRLGLRKAGQSLVDWERYFYPLDAIAGWNRAYGPRGFVQFQCALPLDAGQSGLKLLLQALAEAGAGCFLTVLKRFGPGAGPVSFPMEGYTLALDLAATPANLKLIERLDQITLDHGGRFYLAKDARVKPAILHAADPRLERFAQWRRAEGLDAAFVSAQSERLGL